MFQSPSSRLTKQSDWIEGIVLIWNLDIKTIVKGTLKDSHKGHFGVNSADTTNSELQWTESDGMNEVTSLQHSANG